MKRGHVVENKILALVRRKGIIRIRDMKAKGIHPEYIRRMLARGLLVRQIRGLYSLPGADFTEKQTLVEVFSVIPHGVVCLVSALRFHDIGTQSPPQVWLALERRAAMPRRGDLPLRIVRFSGRAFSEGVETHSVSGVKIKVYNPAKTVADCFKYRNKIGLDVALEALRETLHERKATPAEILQVARSLRMERVIMPYMEAMVG